MMLLILANLSNTYQKLGNTQQAHHYLQQAAVHSRTPVERETYAQLITQLKKKIMATTICYVAGKSGWPYSPMLNRSTHVATKTY